tara:strand:- start:18 stop:170 length:153 start_codon:yes stop_codon:yes gene_type:complete
VTSKRTKQEQIKVTLPKGLHSQFVSYCLAKYGEQNLSFAVRQLIIQELQK